MDWIMDNLATMVVGGLLLLAVCLAIRSMARTRRKGGCCGGCAGCPLSGNCRLPDCRTKGERPVKGYKNVGIPKQPSMAARNKKRFMPPWKYGQEKQCLTFQKEDVEKKGLHLP